MPSDRQLALENQIFSSSVFQSWFSEHEEQLYEMYQQLKYYNEEMTEEQFLLFAFCKSKHTGYYQN